MSIPGSVFMDQAYVLDLLSGRGTMIATTMYDVGAGLILVAALGVVTMGTAMYLVHLFYRSPEERFFRFRDRNRSGSSTSRS